jgi:hypothetical protein
MGLGGLDDGRSSLLFASLVGGRLRSPDSPASPGSTLAFLCWLFLAATWLEEE